MVFSANSLVSFLLIPHLAHIGSEVRVKEVILEGNEGSPLLVYIDMGKSHFPPEVFSHRGNPYWMLYWKPLQSPVSPSLTPENKPQTLNLMFS